MIQNICECFVFHSDEVSGATLAQRLAASASATPAFDIGAPTSQVAATALGNSSSGIPSVNTSSPSNGQPSRNHQVPYPFSVESLSSSVNSQVSRPTVCTTYCFKLTARVY